VTQAQLDRAQTLGTELVLKLGTRLQPAGEPIITAAATARRARAFTLFLNAYDACQRAVAFLRWDEGDAEKIAPSIFIRAGRRKAKDVPVEPPAPPLAVTQGTGSAPATAAVTTNGG
jgi:hypothetical protein